MDRSNSDDSLSLEDLLNASDFKENPTLQMAVKKQIVPSQTKKTAVPQKNKQVMSNQKENLHAQNGYHPIKLQNPNEKQDETDKYIDVLRQRKFNQEKLREKNLIKQMNEDFNKDLELLNKKKKSQKIFNSTSKVTYDDNGNTMLQIAPKINHISNNVGIQFKINSNEEVQQQKQLPVNKLQKISQQNNNPLGRQLNTKIQTQSNLERLKQDRQINQICKNKNAIANLLTTTQPIQIQVKNGLDQLVALEEDHVDEIVMASSKTDSRIRNQNQFINNNNNTIQHQNQQAHSPIQNEKIQLVQGVTMKDISNNCSIVKPQPTNSHVNFKQFSPEELLQKQDKLGENIRMTRSQYNTMVNQYGRYTRNNVPPAIDLKQNVQLHNNNDKQLHKISTAQTKLPNQINQYRTQEFISKPLPMSFYQQNAQRNVAKLTLTANNRAQIQIQIKSQSMGKTNNKNSYSNQNNFHKNHIQHVKQETLLQLKIVGKEPNNQIKVNNYEMMKELLS